MPSAALNWNDADDNNAFHSKQIVMDIDGTISTEVAIIKNKEDYEDIVTWACRSSNDGKPIAEPADRGEQVDPQGREERRSRQGFPQVFHSAESQWASG